MEYHESPTGNCQVGSLSNIGFLLERLKDKDLILKVLGYIIEQCGIEKRYLLVDIYSSYFKYIPKELTRLGSMDYNSRTGSNMSVVVLNLSDYYVDYFDSDDDEYDEDDYYDYDYDDE